MVIAYDRMENTRKRYNDRTIHNKRKPHKRPHPQKKLQHDIKNRRRKPLQHTNNIPQNTDPKPKHRKTELGQKALKEIITVENVMDVLIPLFMIEVFLCGNLVLLGVVLQAFGVI